jgi:hypothetical protein
MKPESDDFATEHAQPVSPPISPTLDGPLEGFDPDRAGWGRPRETEPAWEQLKRWLRRQVTRPAP